jgi:hypothetical protein
VGRACQKQCSKEGGKHDFGQYHSPGTVIWRRRELKNLTAPVTALSAQIYISIYLSHLQLAGKKQQASSFQLDIV